MKKLTISPPLETKQPLPFFEGPIKAGFPSPAEDFLDKPLDLNEHLIKHKAATFFVKVEGSPMEDAFIFEGDILIVDRAIKAQNKDIVLALINGEFTVKRLCQKKEKLFLFAEKEGFSPIEITPSMDFEVWGVVTYIIHKAK